MSSSTSAHSVVAPSAASRRIAAVIVIAYALITIIPLAWIFMTSFKSPPDSISYPPKILFTPSLEGYCNLFTTRTRQTPDYIASLPRAAVARRCSQASATRSPASATW
jgi:multiple sugar transport system permease protein